MDKKSLLKTLKTTKKANVIKAGAKNEGSTSRKSLVAKKATVVRPKMFKPGP